MVGDYFSLSCCRSSFTPIPTPALDAVVERVPVHGRREESRCAVGQGRRHRSSTYSHGLRKSFPCGQCPVWRCSFQVNGVFVAGAVPQLILQSPEVGLRAHPFTLDGAIASFTPFNAVRVSSGFAYLTALSRTMRIGKLPVSEVEYRERQLAENDQLRDVIPVAKGAPQGDAPPHSLHHLGRCLRGGDVGDEEKRPTLCSPQ